LGMFAEKVSRRRTWRCQRRQKSHGPWFVFRIVFN
jgi:hypothetical protein